MSITAGLGDTKASSENKKQEIMHPHPYTIKGIRSRPVVKSTMGSKHPYKKNTKIELKQASPPPLRQELLDCIHNTNEHKYR